MIGKMDMDQVHGIFGYGLGNGEGKGKGNGKGEKKIKWNRQNDFERAPIFFGYVHISRSIWFNGGGWGIGGKKKEDCIYLYFGPYLWIYIPKILNIYTYT